MQIRNLLRRKLTPEERSHFLDEFSTPLREGPPFKRGEPKLTSRRDFEDFNHFLSIRDFEAALEIILRQSKQDIDIFLIRAFSDAPEIARDFVFFWKSKYPSISVPELKMEQSDVESFDDLEFNVSFNGTTYNTRLEENPRVRLNELHLPKSPSFFKWFGDSEVVDQQGRPLLVYHGTNTPTTFEKPKPFSHFGTLRAAGNFATHYNNKPPRIMPFYLKIESPLEVYDIDDKHTPLIWLYLMANAGAVDSSVPEDYVEEWGRGHSDTVHGSKTPVHTQWNILRKLMDEAGYDGFVYMNAHEDEGSWSWVPLYDNQIMNAIEAQSHIFEPDENQSDLFNKPGDLVPSVGDNIDPTLWSDTPYPAYQKSGYTPRRDYSSGDDFYYDVDEKSPRMFSGYSSELSPMNAVELPESMLTELRNPTSPAFRQWMKDSEIQHPVYHATSSKKEFGRPHGFSHFGTLDAAHDRIPQGYPGVGIWDDIFSGSAEEEAERRGLRLDQHVRDIYGFDLDANMQGSRIMPFYLRITNALEVEDHGGNHDAATWLKLIYRASALEQKIYEGLINHFFKIYDEPKRLQILTRVMKKLGYDGFVYMNEVEDAGEWSYVPLYPWQIVSAIQAQDPNFTPPSPSSLSDPRQMPLQFGESKMNEQIAGPWGSGWHNPFQNSNAAEPFVQHIDIIESYPEVFGFEKEDVEGKSENYLIELYEVLFEDGWIRYYWAETTLVFEGNRDSLKKAQQEGFFKEVFSKRTPHLVSFTVDGANQQFSLPADKGNLAKFLVTFSTPHKTYEKKEEIRDWSDIKLFPDEDIF